MKRLLTVVLLSICALGFGCEESAEDQVLAQYQRAEAAIAALDPAEWRAVMSTDTAAMHLDILRLALDGSVTETRSLVPSKLSMVLMLRNRVEPDRLRTMTLDDYMLWQIDEELMYSDADFGIAPHSVLMQGDRAKIQMGFESESQSAGGPRIRTGRRGRGAIGSVISLASAASRKKEVEPIEDYLIPYVSIDGFWYYDGVEDMLAYDAHLLAEAKEAGLPIDRYLSEQEKEDFGSLKPTIWLPVGR